MIYLKKNLIQKFFNLVFPIINLFTLSILLSFNKIYLWHSPWLSPAHSNSAQYRSISELVDGYLGPSGRGHEDFGGLSPEIKENGR